MTDRLPLVPSKVLVPDLAKLIINSGWDAVDENQFRTVPGDDSKKEGRVVIRNDTRKLGEWLRQEQNSAENPRGSCCDVVLVVDDGKVPCHSQLLMHFSPLLKHLIQENMKLVGVPSLAEPLHINLPGYDIDQLRSTIRCFYVGFSQFPNDMLPKVYNLLDTLKIDHSFTRIDQPTKIQTSKGKRKIRFYKEFMADSDESEDEEEDDKENENNPPPQSSKHQKRDSSSDSRPDKKQNKTPVRNAKETSQKSTGQTKETTQKSTSKNSKNTNQKSKSQNSKETDKLASQKQKPKFEKVPPGKYVSAKPAPRIKRTCQQKSEKTNSTKTSSSPKDKRKPPVASTSKTFVPTDDEEHEEYKPTSHTSSESESSSETESSSEDSSDDDDDDNAVGGSDRKRSLRKRKRKSYADNSDEGDNYTTIEERVKTRHRRSTQEKTKSESPKRYSLRKNRKEVVRYCPHEGDVVEPSATKAIASELPCGSSNSRAILETEAENNKQAFVPELITPICRNPPKNIGVGQHIKCYFCKEYFDTESDLTKHAQQKCAQHLNDQYIFERRYCLMCRTRFSSYSLYGLIRHCHNCYTQRGRANASEEEIAEIMNEESADDDMESINGNLEDTSPEAEHVPEVDDIDDKIDDSKNDENMDHDAVESGQEEELESYGEPVVVVGHAKLNLIRSINDMAIQGICNDEKFPVGNPIVVLDKLPDSTIAGVMGSIASQRIVEIPRVPGYNYVKVKLKLELPDFYPEDTPEQIDNRLRELEQEQEESRQMSEQRQILKALRAQEEAAQKELARAQVVPPLILQRHRLLSTQEIFENILECECPTVHINVDDASKCCRDRDIRKCWLCFKYIPSESPMDDHYRVVHYDQSEKPRELTCHICRLPMTYVEVFRHMKTHFVNLIPNSVLQQQQQEKTTANAKRAQKSQPQPNSTNIRKLNTVNARPGPIGRKGVQKRKQPNKSSSKRLTVAKRKKFENVQATSKQRPVVAALIPAIPTQNKAPMELGESDKTRCRNLANSINNFKKRNSTVTTASTPTTTTTAMSNGVTVNMAATALNDIETHLRAEQNILNILKERGDNMAAVNALFESSLEHGSRSKEISSTSSASTTTTTTVVSPSVFTKITTTTNNLTQVPMQNKQSFATTEPSTSTLTSSTGNNNMRSTTSTTASNISVLEFTDSVIPILPISIANTMTFPSSSNIVRPAPPRYNFSTSATSLSLPTSAPLTASSAPISKQTSVLNSTIVPTSSTINTSTTSFSGINTNNTSSPCLTTYITPPQIRPTGTLTLTRLPSPSQSSTANNILFVRPVQNAQPQQLLNASSVNPGMMMNTFGQNGNTAPTQPATLLRPPTFIPSPRISLIPNTSTPQLPPAVGVSQNRTPVQYQARSHLPIVNPNSQQHQQQPQHRPNILIQTPQNVRITNIYRIPVRNPLQPQPPISGRVRVPTSTPIRRSTTIPNVITRNLPWANNSQNNVGTPVLSSFPTPVITTSQLNQSNQNSSINTLQTSRAAFPVSSNAHSPVIQHNPTASGNAITSHLVPTITAVRSLMNVNSSVESDLERNITEQLNVNTFPNVNLEGALRVRTPSVPPVRTPNISGIEQRSQSTTNHEDLLINGFTNSPVNNKNSPFVSTAGTTNLINLSAPPTPSVSTIGESINIQFPNSNPQQQQQKTKKCLKCEVQFKTEDMFKNHFCDAGGW